MTYAVGPDLSRYNVSFDPNKASGAIDFAIQKATEGTSYVDLKYEEIWQGVQRITVRGAYHYQRSGMSWLAQSNHFLKTAARHDYQLFALDLEETNNEYTNTFFADAKRIIDHWRAETDKKVVLYTNGSTFNQMMIALRSLYGSAGVLWMLEVPLWIASPAIAGVPILPKYRTNGTWLIHQYSWSGLTTRWGTGGTRVDENVFYGDYNNFRTYFNLGVSDDDTQEEEQMPIYQGTVLATATLQIRSTPEVVLNPSNDIGDLHYQDKVEASDIVGGWWKLTKVNGQPKTGYAFSNNGAWIRTDAIPPDPQPVHPVRAVVEYSDGSKWESTEFVKVG